ncbi:aldo/keto reductase [Virgibacillus sp. LDC-1]|uniref:aldo/keto reductase n=1 Tax=Virgibacillus sp. LDC-1 TaxID=3039856 RepID=UPI0024DDFB76|nr:aldo/keto reductase [Virgibacillus sp. LDC-1]
MISHLADTITLNNGVKMPGVGLGVYKVENGPTVEQAVKVALDYGYRSVDTASFYGNEEGIGKALAEVNIPRDQLFITSKVWNDEQGYDAAQEAFHRSLQRLGLDYLDLYLIHWPVKGMYKDTWQALEALYEEGKVRAIGVSNFHIHHLQDLLKESQITPAVNQVEYHPHLTQEPLKAFCEKQGIQLEAWSPLKRGRLLEEPTIKDLANKYGKTPAQIILRWNVQHRVITIPKSIHPERIKENGNVFDFSLTEHDMQLLDRLNRDDRSGTNPDSFDTDHK